MQESVLQMKHVIDGHELSLKQVKQPQVPDITATLPLVTGGGTVVVRGYQHPISQEMIDLYFTNASKSGGGKIANIVIREKEVYIVFTEQTGMIVFMWPVLYATILGFLNQGLHGNFAWFLQIIFQKVCLHVFLLVCMYVCL